jgi:ABC-type transport system involved in multi-copper enzyme maturation permease subunit
MMKLLKIESVKVLPYRVFQILAILYAGAFLLSASVFPMIKMTTNLADHQDLLNLKSLYFFPQIWDTFAYFAAKSNIFLAIIVIFLVGNEYSYNTFRQQVVNGLSRQDLLNGKMLVIVGIALVNTLMVLVFGIIFGLIYSTGFTFQDVFSHIYMLGIYFVQAVGHMIAAMMIAVWLRNKTLAMVVLIVYQFIVEPILRLVLNKYVWVKLGLFFPMRVITKLTPLPDIAITEMIKSNTDLMGMTMKLPLWLSLLLAVGYSLIFYLITRAILIRRNL